jgi:hypothetical protein
VDVSVLTLLKLSMNGVGVFAVVCAYAPDAEASSNPPAMLAATNVTAATCRTPWPLTWYTGCGVGRFRAVGVSPRSKVPAAAPVSLAARLDQYW